MQSGRFVATVSRESSRDRVNRAAREPPKPWPVMMKGFDLAAVEIWDFSRLESIHIN